jgi:hypothetical protein
MRLHGEHGEALDLVVIARVIAEGPLVGLLAGLQVALEDDLRAGRHLQVVVAAQGSDALVSSVLAPRSRPAKAYSESASGTGVTAPRVVAGSAPRAMATG